MQSINQDLNEWINIHDDDNALQAHSKNKTFKVSDKWVLHIWLQ